jgi:hypothetical protein
MLVYHNIGIVGLCWVFVYHNIDIVGLCGVFVYHSVDVVKWCCSLDETAKTKAPCCSRCDTIKIRPYSKALSAEHIDLNIAALRRQYGDVSL